MADRRQGKRIAAIRERRGLSQEETARRVDVSTSAYQKWELGGGIRGANMRRLADVLGVDLHAITGEAEPPDPFTLAAHLDPQIDEFRDYVTEMQSTLAAISARMERVIALLETIAAGVAEPATPAAIMLEAGRSIERAAQTRAADRDAPASDQAAGDE